MNAQAPRTDAQIVDQTEQLAVMLMSWAHQRTPASGVLMRNATDPRGLGCWQMACRIQDFITATDVENALAEVDDDANVVAAPEEVGSWNLFACAQESGKEYWVASGPGGDMRRRLQEEAARGRDVWLISPKGVKHLPIAVPAQA